MLTATTTWGVGEPGGPMGRLLCPHASSPGPLWLHSSQSRAEQSTATASSCTFPTFPSPSLLVGVWVSQLPGGWAVPRPPQPPPARTARRARVTPAPGRAVPAAAKTAAGPSRGPGDVSGARGRLLLADAEPPSPTSSSPCDAHLLPRGCWGGLGACVSQLGGLNLLRTLLCPWWSPEQHLLTLPVSVSTEGSRGWGHEQSRSSGSWAGGPGGQPWGLLCRMRPPGPAEVGRSKAKHREPREGVFTPPSAGKTSLPQDTPTHLVS